MPKRSMHIPSIILGGIIISFIINTSGFSQSSPPHSASELNTNSGNLDSQNFESECAEDHLIIKLKTGVNINSAEFQDIFKDLQVDNFEKVFKGRNSPPPEEELKKGSVDLSNIWIVYLAGDERDVPGICGLLSKLPFVEYAEPDYIGIFTSTVPDDTFWGIPSSWDPEVNYQWNLEMIQADMAWDITTGSPNLVMALIDTGFDYNHPDLANNIWINPGEDHEPLGSVGPEDFDNVDDDTNGYIDDIMGWHFRTAAVGNNELMDAHGHGTWVIGIAGAAGNNSKGMTGVTWNSKIMGLNANYYNDCPITDSQIDCTKGCGYSLSSAFSSAIDYAVIKNADVINLSIIWIGRTDQALKSVVKNAHTSGVTIVNSSGNNNRDADLRNVMPSRWPWVISVGGTDQFDNRWNYYYGGANFGTCLDVVAPAGGPHVGVPPMQGDPGKNSLGTLSELSWLEQCIPENIVPEPGCVDPDLCASQYTREWGTSASAPIVTGLVGLIKSYHPEFTNEHIRQIIRQSADDLLDPEGIGDNLPGFDIYSGYGRINAYNALLLSDSVDPMEALIESPLPMSPLSGTIDIEGIARDNPTNPSENFQEYQLVWGYGLYPETWNVFATSSTPVDGLLGSLDTTLLDPGKVTIKLIVRNNLDQDFEDRLTIEVFPPPPPSGEGPAPMMGFPSSDPDDGKFVTVTGSYGTIPKAEITFYIQVPANQDTFYVDLFDGDQGTLPALNGRGFGDWCYYHPLSSTTYTLYADKLMDGTGDKIIGQKTEDPTDPSDDFGTDYSITHLVDGIDGSGSFSVHYCGQGNPACPTEADCPDYDCALAPSTMTYNYRVHVVLWDVNSGFNNPNPDTGCFNSFKVLANARIGIFYDEYFQIMAFDQTGDFVPGQYQGYPPAELDGCGVYEITHPWWAYGHDTSFDGTFQFFYYVPESQGMNHFIFQDADADFLCDGFLDGCTLNQAWHGKASGANYMIKYLVTNPEGEYLRIGKTLDGETIYRKLNNDVSGSYWPQEGEYDLETTEAECYDWATGAPMACLSGIYRWLWYGVFAENNIHMIPPFGSTYYMLYAEPVKPLPTSGAKNKDFYKGLSDKELKEFLPLVLGLLDENGKPVGASEIIRRPCQVREIYYLAEGDCPKCKWYPEEYNQVRAQLLTAKFNLKSAEKRGEPLADATVMGSDRKVSEVVSAADALIAELEVKYPFGCICLPLIRPTSEQTEEMNELLRFLEIINRAEVIFYHSSYPIINPPVPDDEGTPQYLDENIPGP